MITAIVDKDDYDTLLRVFNAAGKNVDAGMKKAVNKTARDGRKIIYEKVKNDYVVKGKGVKLSDLKIKNATNSSSIAEIRIGGRPISLHNFRTRKNTKQLPVRAQVKTNGSMKALQKGSLKAFVSKMKNGHSLVLQRKGADRFPIKALKGPGAAKMAEKAYEQTGPEIRNTLKIQINNMVVQMIGGKA